MSGQAGARTVLEALAADPGRSGLVLDFDGVLAPIVADPTASAMPDRVAKSLARLAGGLGLVAVISGRPVGFLEDRVKAPGVPLLGSYGMEQSFDGAREILGCGEARGAVGREGAGLDDVVLDRAVGPPAVATDRVDAVGPEHTRQPGEFSRRGARDVHVRRVHHHRVM